MPTPNTLPLTKPPLDPRDTERRAQELFNEVLKSYFNGQPHRSTLGDATFPLCDLFFNQQTIDAPDANPQIHLVFTTLRPQEWWFVSTEAELCTWQRNLDHDHQFGLASGVSLGATTDAHIEESVHGALARRFPGVDLRYRYDADAATLFEEAQAPDGSWSTVRSFPGAAGLKWARTGSAYTESTVDVDGTPIATIRTLVYTTRWSGAAKLVVVDSTISFYVRAPFLGDTGQGQDYLCRRVADNLKELFESELRGALAAKGIYHCRVTSGPTPLASTRYATRLLSLACKWRYTVPRS